MANFQSVQSAKKFIDEHKSAIKFERTAKMSWCRIVEGGKRNKFFGFPMFYMTFEVYEDEKYNKAYAKLIPKPDLPEESMPALIQECKDLVDVFNALTELYVAQICPRNENENLGVKHADSADDIRFRIPSWFNRSIWDAMEGEMRIEAGGGYQLVSDNQEGGLLAGLSMEISKFKFLSRNALTQKRAAEKRKRATDVEVKIEVLSLPVV